MDPATFPFGHIGLDGSLLAIAEEAGVEINHSCGGVCACSTCHVYVQKGRSPVRARRRTRRRNSTRLRRSQPDSRLSCQCVPDGSADVVVVVPKWNRNQVMEGSH